MIRAVLSLLRRRDPRHVFEFFDGTRTRAADPIEVSARLDEALGGDWRKALAASHKRTVPGMVGDLRDRYEAHKRAAAAKLDEAVRVAFEVRPVHASGGLTATERSALVLRFFFFTQELANAARPLMRACVIYGGFPTGLSHAQVAGLVALADEAKREKAAAFTEVIVRTFGGR